MDQLSGLSEMQILVLPHLHSDLCWPDIPEVCTDAYLGCIDDAIKYSSDSAYRFTVEHAMFLKEFLSRNPGKREAVKQALEHGNLDCGAFYTGPTELTLGGEGLIRELYLGKLWLENELGFKLKTAWNVDAPGHIGQLPQILAKAGVECFFLWKAFIWEKNYGGYVENPHYFSWKSPDGSHVVVCSTPYGYGLGDIVHIKEDYALFEECVQPYIDKIRDEMLEFGAPLYILITDDNNDLGLLSHKPVENISIWNEKHADLKIRLVNSTEFADMLISNDLPVSSGEMPCWWDTVMTFETERVLEDRWGEGRLLSAECATALASIKCKDYSVPRYDLEAAWEARLFACEHNEGGNEGNLSDMLKEYKVKAASHLAIRSARSAVGAIAHSIKPAQNTGFVLFNPLSWKRRCLTRLNFEFQHNDLPPMNPYTKKPIYTDNILNGFSVIDANGCSVPSEVCSVERGSDGGLKNATVIVDAKFDGGQYQSFSLLPTDDMPAVEVDCGSNVIENELYRIEMDKSCGALTSIYDKLRQRELLDVSKYFGGELVVHEDFGHDETEEFTGQVWRMRDYSDSEISATNSELRSVLKSAGEMMGCKRRMEVALSPGSDLISITIGIDWQGIRDLNMRVAFPFNLFVPIVSYGVPFGYVEYEQEHPDCTNIHPSVRGVRDWFDFSDRDFGITVATEVIPIDFADRLEPETMQPLAQPMLIRSTYSCFDHIYVNNGCPIGAHTNRNTPCQFNKGGEFEFHFVVRPHSGKLDTAAASRMAWEMLHPAVSAYLEADNIPYATSMRMVSQAVRQGDGNLDASAALLQSHSNEVIHTVTKVAEQGEGIILRMYDASGDGGLISFEFCNQIISAFKTDILEHNLEELPFNGCTLDMEVPPFSIETIRVVLETDV